MYTNLYLVLTPSKVLSNLMELHGSMPAITTRGSHLFYKTRLHNGEIHYIAENIPCVFHFSFSLTVAKQLLHKKDISISLPLAYIFSCLFTFEFIHPDQCICCQMFIEICFSKSEVIENSALYLRPVCHLKVHSK